MKQLSCAICGKLFERKRGSKRVTCSDSCKVALGWVQASPEKRAERLRKASETQTKAGAGKKLNAMRWARPGERERSAEENRRRWAEPSYNERVSAAISAAHCSPEGQQKLSAAGRKRWQVLSYRERMTEAARKRGRDPKYLKLWSNQRRAAWQDPVQRKRYMAGLLARMPAHSAFMKARWAASKTAVVRPPLEIVRPPLTIVRPPLVPKPKPAPGFSMIGSRIAKPAPVTRGRVLEISTGVSSQSALSDI